MRLRGHLDERIGPTTRKTFERGARVKPETRTEYVNALASVFVELGFPRPLPADDPMSIEEMTAFVAGGIGEYCIQWDHCQGYFEAYGLRGADPLLTSLPMLRLALQDLGVRVALHVLAHYRDPGEAFMERLPEALVDGSAFIGFVRFLLRRRGMRRADLHVEVFGATSYESWEAGNLPQSSNIEELADVLGGAEVECHRIELELRVVVGLCELWRWLNDVGLPEPHRRELARSFVEWVACFTLGFVGGVEGNAQEREATRLVGLVRGARHEPIGRGVAGLGACATTDNFAHDLHVLSGNWYPAIRRWHGFLDETTGAEDVRAGSGHALPPEWPDRDVVAWALASFRMKMNPDVEPQPDEADGTPRVLEARAAAAMRAGQPAAAEQILSVAVRQCEREPWLHIKLAEALEAQGKLDKAEVEILVAIGLDVGETIQDARLLRARILLGAGRAEEALEALAAAEKITAQNPVVAEFEGHALRELERPEDALAAYIRSRKLNARHLPGWKGEALTLLELDRLSDARKAAKEAAHLGDAGVLHLVDAVRANRRKRRRKK